MTSEDFDHYVRTGQVYCGGTEDWMKPALRPWAERTVAALVAADPMAILAADKAMEDAATRMTRPCPETLDQYRSRIDKERARFLRPFCREYEAAYQQINDATLETMEAAGVRMRSAREALDAAHVRADREIGPESTAWEALGSMMLGIQCLGEIRITRAQRRKAVGDAANMERAARRPVDKEKYAEARRILFEVVAEKRSA